MEISVHERIFSNPFTILGLHPSATAREIRNRVEELEMLASLGDNSVELISIVRARNELSDTQFRLAAEFLAPWQEDPVYGPVADAHDRELDYTRATLQRSGTPSRDLVIMSLWGWASIAVDDAVVSVVQARIDALDSGLAAPSWNHMLVSRAILPAIVQRAVNTDVFDNSELLSALCNLTGVDTSSAIRIIGEDYLSALSFSAESPLPPDQISPLIEDLSDSLPLLRQADRDLWEEVAAQLVRAAYATIDALMENDEILVAGRLLASVDALDLPTESKQKVHHDLRRLRYIWAWKQANDQAELGAWQQVIQALERARENAESDEEIARVDEALLSARMAAARNHRGAPSRRSYSMRQDSVPQRAPARPQVVLPSIGSMITWIKGTSRVSRLVMAVVLLLCVVGLIDWYSNSVAATRYERGMAALNARNFDAAVEHFAAAGRHERSEEMLARAIELRDAAAAYERGVEAKEGERWGDAEAAFREAGTYRDADDLLAEVVQIRSYDDGLRLLAEDSLDEAEAAFIAADGYADAPERLKEVNSRQDFEQGMALLSAALASSDPSERLDLLSRARESFASADGFRDSAEQIEAVDAEIKLTRAWLAGVVAEEEENFITAERKYLEAGKDALAKAVAGKADQQRHYNAGREAAAAGDYVTAHNEFTQAGSFKDAASRAQEAQAQSENQKAYEAGMDALEDEEWDTAIEHFSTAGTFKDAPKRIVEAETSRHLAARYGSATTALAEGRYADAYHTLTEIHSVRRDFADVAALINRIESTVQSPIVFDLSMLNSGNSWSTTIWVSNVLGEDLFQLTFSRSWGHINNDSLTMGVQMYPPRGLGTALGLLAEDLGEESPQGRVDFVARSGERYTVPGWNGYSVDAHIVAMNVEWNPTLYDDYYYPGAVFRSLTIEVTLYKGGQ